MRLGFAFLFILSTLLIVSATALAQPSVSRNANQDQLYMEHRWTPEQLPEGSSPLDVRIVEKRSVNGGSSFVLRIYRNNLAVLEKEATTSSPGYALYPKSVFTLQDGNLATLWETGIGGHFVLKVFSYDKERVREVLQATSRIAPEFVYPAEGKLMNTSRGDSDIIKQNITVANCEWTMPAGQKERQLLPLSADIYKWDSVSKQYKVRKDVPWKKRF